jgi:hypothetical protein
VSRRWKYLTHGFVEVLGLPQHGLRFDGSEPPGHPHAVVVLDGWAYAPDPAGGYVAWQVITMS